jgi:hypothetical protein
MEEEEDVVVFFSCCFFFLHNSKRPTRTKPDGQVVGSIPLHNQTVITVMPAPESSFRISYTQSGEKKFRDFMCESAAAFPTWVRHLTDEIRTQSSKSEEVVLGLGQQARPDSDLQTFSTIVGDVGLKVDRDKGATGPSNPELEAEVLLLRERVLKLEKENAMLKSIESDDQDAAAAAAKLMSKMGPQSGEKHETADVQALKDKIEDLEFKLANCQKRLKVAQEQIKKLNEQLGIGPPKEKDGKN